MSKRRNNTKGQGKEEENWLLALQSEALHGMQISLFQHFLRNKGRPQLEEEAGITRKCGFVVYAAPRFSYQVLQNLTKCRAGYFGSISFSPNHRRHCASI